MKTSKTSLETTVWIIRWNRYDSFLYNKSWEIGRKITLPSVCELCVSTVIHHNVLHPTINIGILITSYLINMRIHLSTYQYESGLGFCIIRSHNLVHHISIFKNFFSIIEKMIWKLGNYRKIVHWYKWTQNKMKTLIDGFFLALITNNSFGSNSIKWMAVCIISVLGAPILFTHSLESD